LSAASHPRSAAVHVLASEWSCALSEVCEMAEALHSTHGSGLRSGEFGGHSTFAMKLVQLPSVGPQ